MTLPKLMETEIRDLVPEIEHIDNPIEGGQKIVYPCTILGNKYALKVLLASPSPQPEILDDYPIEVFDDVTARARREIETMSECDIPYLVKPGPIGLKSAVVRDQRIVYFTEEWVDGQNLYQIIQQDGPLPLREAINLGINIAHAVNELSKKNIIHRDIKPKNIMRQNATGDFILIDLGLAFDLDESSITPTGLVPGTTIYLSPEQITSKRQMDFRSDLFALGITLYEAVTGRHPYYREGMTKLTIYSNILSVEWGPPSVYRREIPSQLDEIIHQRLLDKRAHMRYKNCEQLITAFNSIPLG